MTCDGAPRDVGVPLILLHSAGAANVGLGSRLCESDFRTHEVPPKFDHVTLTRGAGALAVATNKLASTSVPESKVLPPARWVPALGRRCHAKPGGLSH